MSPETLITKAETFNSGTDRRASRTRAFHNQTAEGAQLLSPGGQSIWNLKLGTWNLEQMLNLAEKIEALPFKHFVENLRIVFCSLAWCPS